MTDVVFRLGGLADVEAIRDLTRRAYARWVPTLGREPKPMKADYAAAAAAHRFDLAYIEGELAGLIETEARVDHLYVVNVAVDPTRQGQGLGSRLLDLAERLAMGMGLSEVRLLTNQKMAANISLYQRLGYEIASVEDFGHALGVHMRKPLA